MGKGKIIKFNEMETFDNVIQPQIDEVFKKDYKLKGNWADKHFKNAYPIVLELGCGKGEYTIGLSQKYSENNYIGVDIKGARIWKGAKYAVENNIKNVAFLRTRIEFINSFFAKDEVNEIWITFPDPQLKKRRNKKRLSGSIFLNYYRKFIVNNGIVHLKTDNTALYDYTLNLVKHNNLEIIFNTSDLYSSNLPDDILSVQTFYEKQFLAEGLKIKYLKFRLDITKDIQEPPDEE